MHTPTRRHDEPATATRRRDAREPATAAARAAVLTLALTVTAVGCTSSTPDSAETSSSSTYSVREVTDGTTAFVVVTNPGDGPTLSYSVDSETRLLTEETDGTTFAFKDMNGNGVIDPWEDWRESAEVRAADLAPQLSVEQIAGLMLFSPHERSPADGLTPSQRTYLTDDHLRLVLSAGSNDVKDNVTWSNEIQALAETLASDDTPYVPVTFSSDPRSDASGGYSGSATAEISLWPGNLGLAATFDPDTVLRFGQVSSLEYRALGLTNALSPQIDVASDPRWLRDNGTFGEDPQMSAAMAAAFVAGFQNTYDASGEPVGWGDDSVSTVIKHFAGDAAGEGGRASYNDSGKYAVFPGGNLDTHMGPFRGALDSAGLMTTYSILIGADGEPLVGDRVAASFNKDLIDILRDVEGYDSVIITDWGVTAGGPADPDASWYTSWGVEDLTVDERHFLALTAGVDMFGGNSDNGPVLAAYAAWQAAYEAGDLDVDADARFALSAERILTMVFESRLYDNPYLDLEHSLTVVGSADKVAAGFQAQLDSVVVLKNDGALSCPASAGASSPYADATVYIPRTFDTGTDELVDGAAYTEGPSVTPEIAEQYFGTVVTDEAELDADGRVVSYTAPDLSDVDVVLVQMTSPNNGYGFSPAAGMDPATGEYYPISLQYRPYTADGPHVRPTSISGNILADGTQENRSYLGKTSRISNEADLDAFERAVQAVEDSGKDIPVLTMLNARNPIIPAEFEPRSDAVAVGFDISENAIIEVLLGMQPSRGRLPMTFPTDMDTVEANQEDVPFDLAPYVDSSGNTYEFGFGLSCDGSPIR